MPNPIVQFKIRPTQSYNLKIQQEGAMIICCNDKGAMITNDNLFCGGKEDAIKPNS